MKRIMIFFTGRRAAIFVAALLAVGLSTGAGAQQTMDIDLADIVGGGDGTGDNVFYEGISASDGSYTSVCKYGNTAPTGGANNYYELPTSPYIDGIFVPQGSSGTSAVPVSSTGLTVTDIESTGGSTWDNVWEQDTSNPRVCGVSGYYGSRPLSPTTEFRFHANVGITFDLEAIEASFAGYDATEFDVAFGHGNTNGDGGEVLIVVDGVIKWRGDLAPNSTAGPLAPIMLGTDDRFLTLIATDGVGGYFFDQFYVGDPTVTLTATVVDTDMDGVPDDSDNCPDDANSGQEDSDSDGLGDVCDDDRDGDGIPNVGDNCPDTSNGSQDDFDGDGAGDACDDDVDGDGVANGMDLCVDTATSDSDAGVPSRRLGKNRWADVDGNGMFDTVGKNPTNRDFNIYDTAGCNCAQIIETCGYGKGHTKFGCSNSVMDWWTGLNDRYGQDPYQCKSD